MFSTIGFILFVMAFNYQYCSLSTKEWASGINADSSCIIWQCYSTQSSAIDNVFTIFSYFVATVHGFKTIFVRLVRKKNKEMLSPIYNAQYILE